MPRGHKGLLPKFRVRERRARVAALARKGMTVRQMAKRLKVSKTTIGTDLQAVVGNLTASEMENAKAFRKLLIDRAEGVFHAAWEIVTDPAMKTHDRIKALGVALKAVETKKGLGLPRDPQPQVHLHAHQDAHQPAPPLPPNVREVFDRLPPVESRDYNGDCPTRPDAIDRPSLPPGRGDVVVGRKPV